MSSKSKYTKIEDHKISIQTCETDALSPSTEEEQPGNFKRFGKLSATLSILFILSMAYLSSTSNMSFPVDVTEENVEPYVSVILTVFKM
jgi:hypothetical protein